MENNTRNNCLGHTAYKHDYTTAEIGIYGFLCALFCLVVVFGNVLVIIAIIREREIKNQKLNFYLLSLAVADAFLACLVVPFSITNQLTGKWPFGAVYCQIYSSLDVVFSTASIWHIAMIGLERFFALKFPLFSRTHRSKKLSQKAIALVSVAFERTSIMNLSAFKVERIFSFFKNYLNYLNLTMDF